MVKNLPASSGDAGNMGLIPQVGRTPGEGNGNPFQYSCLENSRDRGAWRAIGHGFAELDTTEHGTCTTRHVDLGSLAMCLPESGHSWTCDSSSADQHDKSHWTAAFR